MISNIVLIINKHLSNLFTQNKIYILKQLFCVGLTSSFLLSNTIFADIPLYWWRPHEGTSYEGTNFGDELSVAIIQKITKKPIKRAQHSDRFKLLGVGSIIQFSKNEDVIWGSGMNGKDLNWGNYPFEFLDVRAVRGPLTQQFLMNLGIEVPSVYGDPALLLPFLFPEFEVSLTPKYKYIVIPHISEISLLPDQENVVLPTAPWREIVEKILQSEFVISSSLHGIVVAEAFGVPARFLRLTNNEPNFKYEDYYLGTGRSSFTPARSIEEALEMGGEPPVVCDLDALLDAFPYDYFL